MENFKIADETLYDAYWEIAGPVGSPTLTLSEHHVLYMLVGHHTLYGSRQLLYIGRTSGIGRRLSEHKRWTEEEADVVEARVASVGPFTTWNERHRDTRARYDDKTGSGIIEHIEALLVYAHQPAYNAHLLRVAPRLPGGSSIRIFNTGRYAPLLPELSTRRYGDTIRPEA